jgi:ABC-type transport system involved in multi-copper enzyme maturation permease subunit
MLARIAAFEVRYQLRQPLFWIAGGIFFLLAFFAITTDAVTIGGSIGNVHRNAPFVIMQTLLTLTAIGTFLTTAFVAGSVHRDFELQTDAQFFSLPIRKTDYLLGRFLGALVVATLVFVGVALAIVVGSLMPWLEPERVGAFRLAPYLVAFVVFVVPNLFVTGSIFFSLATLTRSLLYTYVGVVVFFASWGLSLVLLRDLESRSIAALVDPFGYSAFSYVTRYWTTIERNTGGMPLGDSVLTNRLLWTAVGAAILGFTLVRFRLTTVETRRRRRRRQEAETFAATEAASARAASAPLPRVEPATTGTAWPQFLHQTRLEVRSALRGLPFLILLAVGLFNLMASSSAFERLYGTTVYPVTHLMLSLIQGTFSIFVFLILMIYSGEMVWRDRTARAHEMIDTTPVPLWVMWASRLTALTVLLLALLAAAMLAGIGMQAIRGFPHFEPALYFKGLFLTDAPVYLFLAMLCLFLQVVCNQKYVAWLLTVLVFVGGQVLPALRLEHHLYRFGTAPGSVYSDMNGYGHLAAPMAWFYLYWGFVCAFLIATAHLFWVRGTETSRALRWREARRRLTTPAAAALGLALAGVVATGGFIFYNTNILNHYRPSKTGFDMQAEFEKKYKPYEKQRLPRIVDVKADVDIYPERRAADVRGRYVLRNKTGEPIDTLHLYLNPDVTIRRLEIPGGSLEMEDKDLGYRIWRLATPLAGGADMTVSFDLGVENRGFVNEGLRSELVANGTFFNNFDYFPHVGYTRTRELEDPNERRRRGLPPVQRFPKIDDQGARMSNYLSSEADWVHFETTVSTSPDQIALAPGYLQREWTEDGRRHFHYSMDAKIFNFFAYLSARYAVERDRWNDVAIEIYYHPAHRFNVARMIDAVKKSLDYFTTNFGPYQHRQVRIVEFPQYARFAQSFPNTIPFSEGLGFIARLDDEPDAIDYVFYVTAHEVAHQWWAHQVMGGNVQGATLLSETMSQYSALMVMEKEYGHDKMRRFLKYELDQYLAGRGAERIEELPLFLVENQPYIHYRKGSVIMYALRDYVGEEPLNQALAAYVRKVAFQEPPYTTTLEFLDAIKAAVPPERAALLDDLFRSITLYENRATKATWKKRDDGKYVVALEVASSKFRADGQGKETPEPLDDWIDVGVFGDKADGAPPEGTVLALEKRRIATGDGTIEIVVDQEPRKAGIDPFNKLIDRVPDNNIVAVTAD